MKNLLLGLMLCVASFGNSEEHSTLSDSSCLSLLTNLLSAIAYDFSTTDMIEPQTSSVCGVDKVEGVCALLFCYENAGDGLARALTLMCGRYYLMRFNECEAIRPYLDHYPLEPKDIDISLFFLPRAPKQSKVSMARLTKGELVFEYTGDVADKRESYEEALATLREDEARMSQRSAA